MTSSLICITHHITKLTTAMLSAVQQDHGWPLPGMHSTEPVVCNFCRKWSNARFLLFLSSNFFSVFWQKKSFTFSRVFNHNL